MEPSVLATIPADPFAISDTLTQAPDTTEEQVVEEETTPNSEVEAAELQETENVEEVAEKVDYTNHSKSALLALSYKKDGLLPEDFEVKTDMSASELKDLLLQHAEKTVEERVTHDVELKFQEKGYSEQLLEYARLLAEGMDEGEITLHSQYNQLSQWQPETEDHKEQLIRAMYKDRGTPKEDVDIILSNIDGEDELDKRVKGAQVYFKDKAVEMFETAKREHEGYLKEQKRLIQDKENRIKTLISSGKVQDEELDKSEVKEFQEYVLSPTEVVELQTPDGQKVRQKVSKFRKWLLEADHDEGKMLQIALYGFRGKGFYKEKAVAKATDDFLNALEASEGDKINTRDKTISRAVEDGVQNGTLLFKLPN